MHGSDGAFRPGTRVKVNVPELGKSVNATVTSTVPLFDEASRTLKVRLEADNQDCCCAPTCLSMSSSKEECRTDYRSRRTRCSTADCGRLFMSRQAMGSLNSARSRLPGPLAITWWSPVESAKATASSCRGTFCWIRKAACMRLRTRRCRRVHRGSLHLRQWQLEERRIPFAG